MHLHSKNFICGGFHIIDCALINYKKSSQIHKLLVVINMESINDFYLKNMLFILVSALLLFVVALS